MVAILFLPDLDIVVRGTGLAAGTLELMKAESGRGWFTCILLWVDCNIKLFQLRNIAIEWLRWAGS